MPFDLSSIKPRSRTVEIDGVGAVVIREPTLGDYTAARAGTDRSWWIGCVSCADGTPFLPNHADAAQLPGWLGDRLLEEVAKLRPTTPPIGGSSESQAPSSE
jgi:hypothetical protein